MKQHAHLFDLQFGGDLSPCRTIGPQRLFSRKNIGHIYALNDFHADSEMAYRRAII